MFYILQVRLAFSIALFSSQRVAGAAAPSSAATPRVPPAHPSLVFKYHIFCIAAKRSFIFPEEMLHYLILDGGDSTVEKEMILNVIKKHNLALLFVESRPWQAVWFPRRVSDLNRCRNVTSDVEPQLDSNHPGFNDRVYRERREYICDLTKNCKIGDTIPYVDYYEKETATWKTVYEGLKAHHEKWACTEYLRYFKELEEAKIYSSEFIPQLQDVSTFLEGCTGFQLSPVSGLLSARDFLASLAFKVFQCTQYVRHHSSPMHTPEPDCCHELLGHVPMLCDPTFASFSQEVGLASLGATDEDIVKLATLYWFTVEFGLCRENGKLKAYGAGLLSSLGELQHALSDVPDHKPLNADVTSKQVYQDATYQSVYFVSSSFENALAQVRSFSDEKIKRNFLVRFDEKRKAVEIVPKMPLQSYLPKE